MPACSEASALGLMPLLTRDSRHARRSVECSGSPRGRVRVRVRG